MIAIAPCVRWFVAPGHAGDAAGDASIPLPVPASLAGSGGITARWGTLDGLTGAIGLSNALAMQF